MRILVVVYEYPPVGGGGGQAARVICQSLAGRGHQVDVLTAHLRGLPHEEVASGVHIIRLPSARKSAYQARLSAMSGYVIMGLAHGMQVIKELKPDLLHVHFAVPSGPVAWALHKATRIPYVLTVHLGDVPGGVPEKTDRWFRWIFPFTHPIWRDAARVIAVSEYTRQLANKHYPVDIQIIPNAIDLGRLRSYDPAPKARPRILFAGRFVPQKNPLTIIQVLSRLVHLDWDCVMIGDGPLKPAVEQAVREAGLEGRVIFPGWIPQENVDEWMASSDILFMPSSFEGLPVAGLHSLAYGLAVVASKIGGMQSLVDEGKNGCLIEIDEPGNCLPTESFAQALASLLLDTPLLENYRQASRLKSKAFDLNRVTDEYESIFKEVLNRQS